MPTTSDVVPAGYLPVLHDATPPGVSAALGDVIDPLPAHLRQAVLGAPDRVRVSAMSVAALLGLISSIHALHADSNAAA
jgi:hypothetical protein